MLRSPSRHANKHPLPLTACARHVRLLQNQACLPACLCQLRGRLSCQGPDVRQVPLYSACELADIVHVGVALGIVLHSPDAIEQLLLNLLQWLVLGESTSISDMSMHNKSGGTPAPLQQQKQTCISFGCFSAALQLAMRLQIVVLLDCDIMDHGMQLLGARLPNRLLIWRDLMKFIDWGRGATESPFCCCVVSSRVRERPMQLLFPSLSRSLLRRQPGTGSTTDLQSI